MDKKVTSNEQKLAKSNEQQQKGQPLIFLENSTNFCSFLQLVWKTNISERHVNNLIRKADTLK